MKKLSLEQKTQSRGYRKFLRNFLFFMSFSHRTRIINTMNYLYYEFKTSQVCIVKENEKKYHNSMSINAYFNEKCLMNGASLKGRQEAFMYQMKVKKFIPIIVSVPKQEIYFPNKSKKDPNCLWINYANIQHVSYYDSFCRILFKDGTYLDCTHPKRIQHSLQQIFRYIKKNTPV